MGVQKDPLTRFEEAVAKARAMVLISRAQVRESRTRIGRARYSVAEVTRATRKQRALVNRVRAREADRRGQDAA